MSDLNKLREKLKTNKPVEIEEVKAPAPKKAPAPVELETCDPDEDFDDGSDDVDNGVDNKANVKVKFPQETEGLSVSPIEQEIEKEMAMLQNEGIFRRELLINLKELVGVHRTNTQALLDIKDILGGKNGKAK